MVVACFRNVRIKFTPNPRPSVYQSISPTQGGDALEDTLRADRTELVVGSGDEFALVDQAGDPVENMVLLDDVIGRVNISSQQIATDLVSKGPPIFRWLV